MNDEKIYKYEKIYVDRGVIKLIESWFTEKGRPLHGRITPQGVYASETWNK